MTITRVQGTSETGSSSSAAPSLTGVATGNHLVLTISNGDATTTISSISDSGGASFVQKKVQQANGLSTWIYLAKSVASGTHTVTVTFSGTVGHQCYLQEYSITGTDLVDDGSGAAATGSSTTPASGSFSTTGSNDLLVGAHRYGASGAPTAGSGWTSRNNQTRSIYEDQLNVAAGSYNADATIPASTTWNAIAFAFTESTGGSNLTRSLSFAVTPAFSVAEISGFTRAISWAATPAFSIARVLGAVRAPAWSTAFAAAVARAVTNTRDLSWSVAPAFLVQVLRNGLPIVTGLILQLRMRTTNHNDADPGGWMDL